ncbi:MAG: DnaB-like helicase C-terminal domain-containing protein [Planctomycetota bacterium]
MMFQSVPWSPGFPPAPSSVRDVLEALRRDAQPLETQRTELDVVATLLSTVNDPGSPMAGAILERVVAADLIHPPYARLLQAIHDLHTAGKFIDEQALAACDPELRQAFADDSLGEVFAAEPILDSRQLRQRIESVIRSGALHQARAALQQTAAQVLDAEENPAVHVADVAESLRRAADTLSAAQHRAADLGWARTLREDLDRTVAGLAETHGKEFLGLPTMTLPTLDRYTLGLRGFLLLAAAPGVGKTSLGQQLGLDIVEYNADAVFIFFSFEMGCEDIRRRLLAMMSGLPWKTVLLGSGPKSSPFAAGDGLRLTDEDRKAFNSGVEALYALGDRIFIFDQEHLGAVHLRSMLAAVQAAKKKSGAQRAFVLVDSLQAMPFERDAGVPWSNDVERDNHVISQMLRLQRTTGDALMLISEQNKVGMGRDDLKSPRGTARGVYSPDTVMILQSPEGTIPDANSEYREVELKIVKGRDGTFRGRISLRFYYGRMTFEEDTGQAPDAVISGGPI